MKGRVKEKEITGEEREKRGKRDSDSDREGERERERKCASEHGKRETALSSERKRARDAM
jgi:hypothetical protein